MKSIEKESNYFKDVGSSVRRLLSIDVYKGLMIAFAIFINATSYFQYSPIWNKGSELYGLTYVDLFGPFFLFALTMTFATSYRHRLENFGKIRTYRHFLRRFSLYILIGFLITIQIEPSGIRLRWGTLQMLGMTGIFLLFTIKIKTQIKIILSIGLIVIHQIIDLHIFPSYIIGNPHGGIFGLLSWFSFALIASMLNEYFMKTKNVFLYGITGVSFFVLGMIMNSFITISRQLLNITFISICLGLSIVVFLLIFETFENLTQKFQWLKEEKFLSVLGKNTLFLYILQSFFKYIPYILLPIDTIPFIFFSFGILMVLLNFLLAYYLDQFQIYLVV
jgi:predicted acyltransferase